MDTTSSFPTDDAVRFNGQTINATGPQQMTFAEVISQISKATGRFISYQPISVGEYALQLKAADLPDEYVWLFTYLFKEVVGNPINHEVSNDIGKVLGRQATDFSEYVERTMETGVWNSTVAVV